MRSAAPTPSSAEGRGGGAVPPVARQGVLVLTIALFVIGTIGSNVGPAWVDERPAVVLAMSSRNRNLLGSVPFIDLLPYATIGFVRVMLAAVALFLLGRWYGANAIRWVEGQVGQLPAIYHWFQTAVDKAGWLMVILMPGSNFVCLMAGHRRMRPTLFTVLAAVGTALKLGVLWWGGTRFEQQIRDVLEVIDRYQWWIVGGLFAITFLQSANKVRTSLPEVLDEIETPDGVVEPHVPHHRHFDVAHRTDPGPDTAGTDRG